MVAHEGLGHGRVGERAQDDALAFLDPTIRSLMPDPLSLTDCEKAAERIASAIKRNEKVAIFGDYDVVIDGVDNFPAQLLINDACFFADKPLVHGGAGTGGHERVPQDVPAPQVLPPLGR